MVSLSPIKRKLLVLLYIAGMFFVLALLGAVYFVTPIQILGQELIIEKGAGAHKVAHMLKTRDMIHSETVFLAYLRLQGSELALRPGAYHVEGMYSIPGLVVLLTRMSLEERTVVVPEGLSVRAVGAILDAGGVIDQTDFLASVLHPHKAIFLAHPILPELPMGSSLEDIYSPIPIGFIRIRVRMILFRGC